MENFLANMIAGLTVPALAIAFKLAFDHWLIGRTKEVVARLENGKVKTFTVHANASDEQVADAVRDGLTLERDVFWGLEKLSRTLEGLRVREGEQVDFIVELPNRTVAIECKSNVDQLDEATIAKHLNAEAGFNTLLIVSRQTAPKTLLQRTSRFIESGQLVYVTIGNMDDIGEKISTAMRVDLRPQHPETKVEPLPRS